MVKFRAKKEENEGGGFWPFGRLRTGVFFLDGGKKMVIISLKLGNSYRKGERKDIRCIRFIVKDGSPLSVLVRLGESYFAQRATKDEHLLRTNGNTYFKKARKYEYSECFCKSKKSQVLSR